MKFVQKAIMICMSSMVILLSGCKKDEGIGGTSTIKGLIMVNDFDHGFQSPQPVEVYAARAEKVYVIYGLDHTTYDNDYSTSYDGSYEFKYLQKGKYRIFAYTKDTTGAYNGTINFNAMKIALFEDVEIKSNGSVVTVPTITILDNNY